VSVPNSIPTPVPQSTWERLKQIGRGSLFDTLWKAFVILVTILLVGTIASLGVVGGVVAFAIIGSLLSENVRNAYRDILDRNFAKISLR
jgi:hypothetical protein